MKVAQILIKHNIEFLSLCNFLRNSLKKDIPGLSLNTKLNSEQIALIQKEFVRDKILKIKKQGIKLPLKKQIISNNYTAQKNTQYKISTKDKKRYISIIKNANKRNKKNNSITKRKQVYIKIFRGGLCNSK